MPRWLITMTYGVKYMETKVPCYLLCPGMTTAQEAYNGFFSESILCHQIVRTTYPSSRVASTINSIYKSMALANSITGKMC